jgi:hypothetical protein
MGVDWHITGPQRNGRAGSVLSRWPLVAWRGATSAYIAKLKQLLVEEWDAVVLDNLGLCYALPLVQNYRKKSPSTKIIYISHEYEYLTRSGKYASYSLGFIKKLLTNVDLAKVRKWENALLTRADIVTVINTSDVISFKPICPEKKYLPLTPGYDGPVVLERTISENTPRRVLLLGGRRSEQKRQILLDWMQVAYGPLTDAGVEMIVVGDMETSLRDHLRKTYPFTRVEGFVDGLEALIGSARLGVIADSVGGGFKMRLLSHVFERLPIVGLSDAIDGLPTQEGRGYLGAKDLVSLVALVCRVVDDVDRLNGLHRAAFDDCHSQFAWQARADVFARIVQGAAADVLI